LGDLEREVGVVGVGKEGKETPKREEGVRESKEKNVGGEQQPVRLL